MTERSTSQNTSLLALDIGSVNTRVKYFDLVEGSYRFLASGDTLSTINAPGNDLNIGAVEVLGQIEERTGRSMFSEDGVFRSSDMYEDGDTLITTFSAGPPLKVITLGLLGGVSLESVNKLVNASYCQVVESFSLNDRRRPETLIDAISAEQPDLILFAGGTDRGASLSVVRLANYLSLALKLLPEEQRPELLFVGNESLHEEMESLLGALSSLQFAANIRPSLEEEHLGPASAKFDELCFELQSKKVSGMNKIREVSGGHFLPTATAFGRTVRFLSKVIDYPKGILGVDIGASSTTIASAFGGQLNLHVHHNIGMGRGLQTLLEERTLSQISRWLAVDVSEEDLLNYLYNKPLAPQSLPVSEQDLAIEQAAAREVLCLAISKSMSDFPESAIYPLEGALPWFDRILLSGSVLSRAPDVAQSLLMALDAIQPVGIATIILDQNNLAAALGASAEIDPLLVVQVLESNSFANLGTVVSPVGQAASGSSILRIQIVSEGQKQEIIEVTQGQLKSIPIPMNKAVDVYIQPLQNMDIGLGPGRGGWVRRVVGGKFGLLVDARGRPLDLPSDEQLRILTLAEWQHSVLKAQA